MEAPKVFISYSRDSSEHVERALALSDRLRQDGIDCHIDQYEVSPPKGWARWTVSKLEWANFVLIVCTKNYNLRFRGKVPSGEGLGTKWEGAIFTKELYETESYNTRFIPLVFSSQDTAHIPIILKGQNYYDVSTDEGYEALYRHLTNQPKIEKPENVSSIAHKYKKKPTFWKKFWYRVGVWGAIASIIGAIWTIVFDVIPPETENQQEQKIINSLGMEFVYIHPGKFMMGTQNEYEGRTRQQDETYHEVTLTKGFYMQTTEVTQRQWKAVMGDNPSHFRYCGDDCPVEGVSWDDVQKFIKRLNQKEGKEIYRLPTEAEWEYACRAGTTSQYWFGDDESFLHEYAWYNKNSNYLTHPVATKKPNAWGLYDMHGNVGEWCEDQYADYPSKSIIDPIRSSDGSSRVIRSGNVFFSATWCRCASRLYSSPNDRRPGSWGFRLKRLVEPHS